MSTDDEDCKVGYGKPPRHTRFQKGKSGNPKGRPKGARRLDVLELLTKALYKKVKVRQGGKVVYLSRLEAGAERFANKVFDGDLQTFRLLLPLQGQIGSISKMENRERDDGDYADAKRRLAILLGLDPKKFEE